MSEEEDLTSAYKAMAAESFQRMVTQAHEQRCAAFQRSTTGNFNQAPRAGIGDFLEGSFRAVNGRRRFRIPRGRRALAVVAVPALIAILAGCSVVASGGPSPLPTLAPLQTVGPAAAPSSRDQSSAAASSSSYLVALGNIDATVSATGQVLASNQAQLAFSQPSTVTKVDVKLGDAVKAGQVLVELAPLGGQSQDSLSTSVAKAQMQLAVDDAKIQQAEAGPSSSDAGKARLAVAQAQAKLDADQAALSKLQAGPDPNAVAAANAVLQQQQAKLDALKAGPRPEQRQILQTQVDAAKNALYSSQASRDGACNKANPDYMCTAANAAVNQAQTNLDAANKQYQLAIAGPTAQDLQQAQQAVAEAQAKDDAARTGPSQADLTQALSLVKADQLAVQLAQAQLDHPSSGNGDDVSVLQAQRSVDQLSLQQAQAALAAQQDASGGNPQATSGRALVAPFDGIVTALSAHVGDVGQTGAVAVTVADPSSDQIVAQVSDSDIGRVAVGQQADVALVRSPDNSVNGQVASIVHVPVNQNGNVLYPITLAVQQQIPSWADLGAGVRVRITTSSEKGVVVVPTSYIKRDTSGKATVQKLVNGKPTDTVVVTGLVGNGVTQITQGLQAGDRIVSTPVLPAPVAGQ